MEVAHLQALEATQGALMQILATQDSGAQTVTSPAAAETAGVATGMSCGGEGCDASASLTAAASRFDAPTRAGVDATIAVAASASASASGGTSDVGDVVPASGSSKGGSSERESSSGASTPANAPSDSHGCSGGGPTYESAEPAPGREDPDESCGDGGAADGNVPQHHVALADATNVDALQAAPAPTAMPRAPKRASERLTAPIVGRR